MNFFLFPSKTGRWSRIPRHSWRGPQTRRTIDSSNRRTTGEDCFRTTHVTCPEYRRIQSAVIPRRADPGTRATAGGRHNAVVKVGASSLSVARWAREKPTARNAGEDDVRNCQKICYEQVNILVDLVSERAGCWTLVKKKYNGLWKLVMMECSWLLFTARFLFPITETFKDGNTSVMTVTFDTALVHVTGLHYSLRRVWIHVTGAEWMDSVKETSTYSVKPNDSFNEHDETIQIYYYLTLL
jgi:hypothetical protein